MRQLLFLGGYRAGASLVGVSVFALVMGALHMLFLQTASAAQVEAVEATLPTIFGMPMWHFVVSVASGGVSYGMMLVRVKRLEEDRDILREELKEHRLQTSLDHDALVRTQEHRNEITRRVNMLERFKKWEGEGSE